MSRETLPLALVLVLIVIGIYVGAYFAMITPVLTANPPAAAAGAPWNVQQWDAPKPEPPKWEANYRSCTPLCRVLFRPLHAVDRQLRPQAFWCFPAFVPNPEIYLCPSHPPAVAPSADTPAKSSPATSS